LSSFDHAYTDMGMDWWPAGESLTAEPPGAPLARRLAPLLDLVPGLVALLDRDERCLFANAAHQTILGLSPAAIRGRPLAEILGPEAYRRIEPYLAKVSMGEAVSVELELLDGAGRPRTLRGMLVPELDPVGGLLGLGLGLDDVTERVTAEHELLRRERWFEALLESTKDGVVLVDEAGIVRVFNPAAARLLGYEPGEVIGRALATLMAEPEGRGHRDRLDGTVAAMAPARVNTGGEIRVRHKTGAAVPLHLSWSEAVLGDERVFLGILTDPEPQRQASRLIAERARELAEANSELRRFTYALSHDLKAPLVNLGGFADLLADAVAELKEDLAGQAAALEEPSAARIRRTLEGDIAEALGHIRRSVEKLGGMTDAILSLTHLGEVEAVPETVDVAALVGDIARDHRYQMETAGVGLDIDRLPTIRIDRFALERILANLVDNAVKYRHDERPGRIAVRATEAGSRLGIVVEDNGRGMAEHEIDRAFQLFKRVGGGDQRGLGVGLTSAQILARRLGGWIACESRLGEGTTFTLWLPRRAGADGDR